MDSLVKNSSTPKVLVMVATYNEAENIGPLISEIHKQLPEAHVLVIDDNSPDKTGQIVDQLAQTDSRIHALHRAGKQGLGTAIIAGIRYAIAHDYDYAINMDADFSHPPRYLPNLVAGMQNHDIMIGSRYIPNGGTRDWPASRKFMSMSVNVLVRFMFRMGVRDASGGMRCYSISKLRQVNLNSILSRGYSFQQELLFRCWSAGCKLGETPIIFENRKFGKSKVNPKEALRSISMIVYLGLRAMFGLDKTR
jgi:dolichol-phosphate mannosyltransferase